MEMSLSQRSCRPAARRYIPVRGFALIEVLVALFVLAIGLVSLAALTATMESGTERSRFMGIAATLATEKLEDLNRWPSWDPNVNSNAGGTQGSLTSDLPPASVTSSTGTTDPSVVYFDDVVITNSGGTADSAGAGTCGTGTGAVGETVSSSAGYTTYYHCADGEMPTSGITSASSTAADVNAIEFHRRWTIEENPTINGTVVNNVRRVTVLVTLKNGYMQPPVSFQMSMVRP
jgi:prepilin-type N-terminal cleavage/methylation domain-containing protein